MNFEFSVDFSLTYCLLTVASFRIGVPSILFLFSSELKGEYSFLNFRTTRNVPSLVRENLLGHNREDIECLHQILNFLFTLLPNAKHYTDLHTHATAKLVAYFQTMSHFLLGPTEKLLFEPHFQNLWQLFHPKLSEPAIPGIHFYPFDYNSIRVF